MATYSTDLQTVTAADALETWVEMSGHTSGQAPAVDTENYIHNGASISQATNQATGTSAGMQYDYGSNIAWTSGDAFFVWQMFAAPTNIFSWSAGGMRFGVGSSSGNINFWNTLGDDFGNYPYGGWQNTAIDPETTPDAIDGSPVAGSYRIFGSLPNMRAKITKGSPHVVDAIRYGRGQLLVTGTGATFAGMAAANDDPAARWGLFQLSGGSYLFKGLMSLGDATTAVTFSDSNKAIRIDDTPRVSAGFNKIEIRNAASSVSWSSVSVSGVETSITGSAPVSPGDFEVVDDATVSLTGCPFTDLGTFKFLPNTTAADCTFRRCGTITPAGATVSGGTVVDADTTIAMTGTVSELASVSGVTFESGGTGHGLEITGTASNITLTNITWNNYAAADGSTGNEAIFVNIASGTMDIVIDGGNTPSIRTAGATVNVIAGAVTVSVQALDISGNPVQDARVHLEATSGGPFPVAASVTIVNSGTTATVTHTNHGMATNDKVVIRGASLVENLGVFPITVLDANTYTYTMASAPGSSPTGSITSTFVALNGVTDASGSISTSRVYPSDQPVKGSIRKASSAPYYKPATLVGTISGATGASFTGVMLSDD